MERVGRVAASDELAFPWRTSRHDLTGRPLVHCGRLTVVLHFTDAPAGTLNSEQKAVDHRYVSSFSATCMSPGGKPCPDRWEAHELPRASSGAASEWPRQGV